MQPSKLMSLFGPALSGWLRRKRKQVISISLTEDKCRWVYGEVDCGSFLRFHRIVRSGGFDIESAALNHQDLCSFAHWKLVIEKALASLLPSDPKVEGVVFCLPLRYGYVGEITTEPGLDEVSLRYQIEDTLEVVAGREEYSAAYDWRLKQQLSDGSQSIAIASIDAKNLNEMMEVCKTLKLECLGVTLDSLASLNGYLSMLPDNQDFSQVGFLIFAELNKSRVRLSVFANGVLLNEVFESSDEDFSVVQAISALERLVSSWSRDSSTGSERSVRMVLGGDLAASKAMDATIKRSSVLSAMIIDVPARRELSGSWHQDVMPYGALEFLPCE